MTAIGRLGADRPGDASRRRWTLTTPVLVVIVIAGALLRIVPVVLADFPLNDGGLFLTMAEDLRTNRFLVPDATTYNGLDIPYAYPPLAFYLTAFLSEFAGLSGLDVLRVVPALFTVATIPVAYAIVREAFCDERMALGTTFLFALAPRSYEWLIGGGGIARAPGFLLALLAVLLAFRMHRAPSRWTALLAGGLLGFAALWHPEAGVFGAVSVLVIALLASDDRWRAARRVAVVAAAAMLVVLPWLVVVVTVHGVGTLLGARSAGGSLWDGVLVLASSRTGGGYLTIMGIASSVGIIVCLMRRQWLIPIWMIAVVLASPRGGATPATLPAAMAVAFLARDVGRTFARSAPVAVRNARSRLVTSVTLAALVFGVGADAVASRLDPLSPLQVLSPSERQAMRWSAQETASDASFIVLSGMPWAVDAEAEWFPALAGRRSLTTVQGYEWLGGGAFRQQHQRADQLFRCAARSDRACIDSWLDRNGRPNYLFLTRSPAIASLGRECCLQVAGLVDGQVVYRNEDVAIVELQP